MRSGRFLLAGFGASAALLLAGCGNSEITVTSSQGGITVSIVVQSDSTGIGLVRQEAATKSNGGNAKVTDGSHPVGPHICGFTASKGGHTYQFDFYGKNLPSGVTTSAVESEFCGAEQTSLMSGLPSS
jgi:hypothetical protein